MPCQRRNEEMTGCDSLSLISSTRALTKQLHEPRGTATPTSCHSMVTLEEVYNKANEQLSVFFAYAKVTRSPI